MENVEDLSDIPAAITAIGSALSSMGTALQSTFDALRTEDVGGELETALDQSESLPGHRQLTTPGAALARADRVADVGERP